MTIANIKYNLFDRRCNKINQIYSPHSDTSHTRCCTCTVLYTSPIESVTPQRCYKSHPIWTSAHSAAVTALYICNTDASVVCEIKITYLHIKRRDVLLSAIGHLLLPALDFGTVYLLTSGLPRHSHHFFKSWKLIHFAILPRHCL